MAYIKYVLDYYADSAHLYHLKRYLHHLFNFKDITSKQPIINCRLIVTSTGKPLMSVYLYSYYLQILPPFWDFNFKHNYFLFFLYVYVNIKVLWLLVFYHNFQFFSCIATTRLYGEGNFNTLSEARTHMSLVPVLVRVCGQRPVILTSFQFPQARSPRTVNYMESYLWL